MKVFVLGATGMLGFSVFNYLARTKSYDVYGSYRSGEHLGFFPGGLRAKLCHLQDACDFDGVIDILSKVKPDVIVNCVGVIKQLGSANDPLHVLPLNSLLPHRLARLCNISNIRIIHISTDCVFSGGRGAYKESDTADAIDLYGRSKHAGELVTYPNAITLRTSIIGHELKTKYSLVDWFLSQEGSVRGFKSAIFSGLPTVELARIIAEYVLPNTAMSGLYHVSAKPISKYDLLGLVAAAYQKEIEIIGDESLVIDRSLDSSIFQSQVGYRQKEWDELVSAMREEYIANFSR